jgi:hypothetical protein
LYTQTGKAFSYSITRKGLDGLVILRQLESKIQQRGVGDPEATYKIAHAYAVLGDKVSALRMLGYSIENGFFSYPYFMGIPFLKMFVVHRSSRSSWRLRAGDTAFKRRFF